MTYSFPSFGGQNTSDLTRQFQKIDPSVSNVSRVDEDYLVKYKTGSTRTLDSTGLKNLQDKYLIKTGMTSIDDSTQVPAYTEFYGAVTPEDIARFSKGYVAPDAVDGEAPKSTTIQPETLAAITPFTPTVPAFTRQGGAPYAGLAALPARAPVSLIQMPTAAPVLAPSVQTIGPGGPVAGMKKGGLASVANRLADKGRGGDSMLVHMSPNEVMGLQALARQQGTTLTINPETGLPEALNLKKVFKVVAPIALGAFLGPGAFGIQGMGMSAAGAGLTVGGLTALATGSLEKGLAAGLGAYGGAGLAEGAAAASTAAEQELARQATLGTGTGTGTVGSGAGGVSSGSVPIGATTVEQGFAMPGAGFETTGSMGFQATGPQISANIPTANYGLTGGQPMADYSSAATGLGGGTAIGPTPMDAFNAKVGMPEYGALYAGSVALPAAVEEQEKFQRQQALIRAKEEEDERKYRELFERTLGAVPTRMARAGGLMSLAGGGMTYMEAGGTTGPTGAPRDVTGTGDGMSDSVPATIEGVQEARLADGEFVVPADVVADIGNGSSDAGSKKLYDMMDRIRKARHGTTEQPPEIDAEALMPA
jgi:hypothetical protein